MKLTQASVSGFRNLQAISLEPSPTFNIILGSNGAGKTSILEAIHLLSTGHSFRTRKSKELIKRDQTQLSVTARLVDDITGKEHRAGISKNLSGDTELRLDFEPLHSMAEMTRLLPVKALYPDSHKLIQEGPSMRRQFLDWGLFHVEHDFFDHWKLYKRALEQRNRALRVQLPEREVTAWNHELKVSGDAISTSRTNYAVLLQTEMSRFLKAFGLPGEITIHYKQGWNAELTLESALAKSLPQCQRFRTTSVGPHRGELTVEVNGIPAKQEMSRGQQKLLVYALHFAQLSLFHTTKQQQVIVLCDDLSAELDQAYLARVLETLAELNFQTFISSNSGFSSPENAATRVFHVEHGEVVKVV